LFSSFGGSVPTFVGFNMLNSTPPMNAPYSELFTGLLVMAHPLVHPK